MTKTFRIAFTMALSLSFLGCSETPSTVSETPSIVKNAFLTNHKETTIGKAFDAYFAASNWVMLKTKNGTQYVEFTGKLKKVYGPLKVGTKVLMQFTIYNDKSFEIKYAGFCELPSKLIQDFQNLETFQYVWPLPTHSGLATPKEHAQAVRTLYIIAHLTPDLNDGTALMLDSAGLQFLLKEIYED